MIEQDTVAGVEAVRLAIINSDPIRENLGAAVRTSRIKRSFLGLRHLLNLAEHLARGSLVEPGLDAGFPNRFDKPHGTCSRDVCRVFRAVETNAHMALRREIVDFIRLGLLDDMHQAARISHVSIVENEIAVSDVRILIQVIDPVGVGQ